MSTGINVIYSPKVAGAAIFSPKGKPVPGGQHRQVALTLHALPLQGMRRLSGQSRQHLRRMLRLAQGGRRRAFQLLACIVPPKLGAGFVQQCP
jgi:uncharacterized membrane protein